MQNMINIVGILLLANLVAAAGANGDPRITVSPKPSLTEQSVDAGDPALAWITEKWTGNDIPYSNARRSIDRLINATNDHSWIVSRYERLAAANPANPLDQFQWAYATYLANEAPHAPPGDDEILDPVIVALANANQPHVYNYTRLRFLLETDRACEVNLGERLLLRDPNDYPVRQIYALVLSDSKFRNDNELGIAMQKEIVSQGIDLPRSYLILGWVYATSGFESKDVDYYKLGVAAFDRFLALAPSDDWRRPIVLHANSVLETRLQSTY